MADIQVALLGQAANSQARANICAVFKTLDILSEVADFPAGGATRSAQEWAELANKIAVVMVFLDPKSGRPPLDLMAVVANARDRRSLVLASSETGKLPGNLDGYEQKLLGLDYSTLQGSPVGRTLALDGSWSRILELVGVKINRPGIARYLLLPSVPLPSDPKAFASRRDLWVKDFPTDPLAQSTWTAATDHLRAALDAEHSQIAAEKFATASEGRGKAGTVWIAAGKQTVTQYGPLLGSLEAALQKLKVPFGRFDQDERTDSDFAWLTAEAETSPLVIATNRSALTGNARTAVNLAELDDRLIELVLGDKVQAGAGGFALTNAGAAREALPVLLEEIGKRLDRPGLGAYVQLPPPGAADYVEEGRKWAEAHAGDVLSQDLWKAATQQEVERFAASRARQFQELTGPKPSPPAPPPPPQPPGDPPPLPMPGGSDGPSGGKAGVTGLIVGGLSLFAVFWVGLQLFNGPQTSPESTADTAVQADGVVAEAAAVPKGESEPFVVTGTRIEPKDTQQPEEFQRLVDRLVGTWTTGSDLARCEYPVEINKDGTDAAERARITVGEVPADAAAGAAVAAPETFALWPSNAKGAINAVGDDGVAQSWVLSDDGSELEMIRTGVIQTIWKKCRQD